jgi:hypothetical protein
VGKKLGANLSKTPWENVREETRKIAESSIQGQPLDPTTQRRALGALRKGVASNVRDKARGKGESTLLNELETPNVQEGLVPLQAGRNVNPDEVRATFAERMRDRRKMATTNAQQESIKAQELLEGSRGAGTALQFQEATALSGKLGAVKTALGALGGKTLAGRRNKMLELSAEQLNTLLQRSANDIHNPRVLFERAMLLKMLQQARMRGQGRAAGAAAGLATRRDQ